MQRHDTSSPSSITCGAVACRSCQTLDLRIRPSNLLCQSHHQPGDDRLDAHIHLRLAALAITTLISACATPYQASGMTGGYEERKLGDGRYWLKFLGNGYTEPQTVEQYWSRRAGELCAGRPFKENARAGYDVKNTLAFVGSSAYPTSERYPMKEGEIECAS
ncbi:hypothetical protein ANAEL_04985 [Anaerolineales bacterium]|nr:hypothetical protein ANAEL_04985 [Anaerolineales bacterium]